MGGCQMQFTYRILLKSFSFCKKLIFVGQGVVRKVIFDSVFWFTAKYFHQQQVWRRTALIIIFKGAL